MNARRSAPGRWRRRLAGVSVWLPKGGGLVGQKLEGPAPADGKVQRLTQMRALAARFAVTCYDSNTNEPRELRLLTQPLYRFEAEKHKISDGALFAFVITNDPEMFLLLEAATDKGPEGSGGSRWPACRRCRKRSVWTARRSGR